MHPFQIAEHGWLGRSLRRVGCLLLLGLAARLQAAPAAAVAPDMLSMTAPTAGYYDARLCVAVSNTPQRCGPVTVDLDDVGQLLVHISDIAYRLEVHGEQLGVTLFHGNMQIDGFFAPYQWTGSQLQFTDVEKSTRYELRLGTRRFDAP